VAWLPAPTAAAAAERRAPGRTAPSPLFLRLFHAAYFCAGVRYVVSATFIVAIVDQAARPAAAATWSSWRWVCRRSTGLHQLGPDRPPHRELNALILAAVLQIVGILLPVAVGGWLRPCFGALLFGGTFIGMVIWC
jgi:hypothetical protein